MIREILEYKKIGESLAERIAKSEYKKEYIVKQSGNSSATFYRKLKNNLFTPDELLKLAKILVPEEYYRYQFEKELEEARRQKPQDLPKRLSPVIPEE